MKDFYGAFNKLMQYCNENDFNGYDPFDGLNSNLFQSLPFRARNNKFLRLAWIQFFKRSPVDFRGFVGIEKEYNPKALGLFLSAYCNLFRIEPRQGYLDNIIFLTDTILNYTNNKWSGACWGYNFDWQSRAFYQPRYTPTIVVTSFIGNALLDAYEITGNTKMLTVARSSCDFLLKDLNRSYDEKGNFAFSYSPLDKSVVYNASLLGSRLLARVFSYTRENELVEVAKKSVSFCCDQQQQNGSWAYGAHSFHSWVDSFHTGFNLEAIADFINFSADHSFDLNLKKGFDYYICSFFTTEGIPKYYNNAIFPVDVHAPAQLCVTLAKLNKIETEKELLNKVLNWTCQNMQSEEGFFYYQINKYYTNKVPYMRWAQAWMFYAFSTYFSYHSKPSTCLKKEG